MNNQSIDYQELNERVEKGIQKQKNILRGVFLAISVGMFALFTAISLIGNGQIAGFMMGIGWLTTLSFFGLSAVADFGLFDKALRRTVMGQMTNEYMLEQMEAAMLNAEKPKRDTDHLADNADVYAVELTDDGELVPLRRQSDGE